MTHTPGSPTQLAYLETLFRVSRVATAAQVHALAAATPPHAASAAAAAAVRECNPVRYEAVEAQLTERRGEIFASAFRQGGMLLPEDDPARYETGPAATWILSATLALAAFAGVSSVAALLGAVVWTVPAAAAAATGLTFLAAGLRLSRHRRRLSAAKRAIALSAIRAFIGTVHAVAAADLCGTTAAWNADAYALLTQPWATTVLPVPEAATLSWLPAPTASRATAGTPPCWNEAYVT
jgi:hypothetical protein